jgi:hypothetical protein
MNGRAGIAGAKNRVMLKIGHSGIAVTSWQMPYPFLKRCKKDVGVYVGGSSCAAMAQQ